MALSFNNTGGMYVDSGIAVATDGSILSTLRFVIGPAPHAAEKKKQHVSTLHWAPLVALHFCSSSLCLVLATSLKARQIEPVRLAAIAVFLLRDCHHHR